MSTLAPALCTFVLGTLVVACSIDSSRGFSEPNLAWSKDGLGLVWLDRQRDYDAVTFGVATQGGVLDGPLMHLSEDARGSDPPLIASDGQRYLVAWTQSERRKSGLFARHVGVDGLEGPIYEIVRASVHLCPRLVWTDQSYVVGWHEGKELFLGRVDEHGLLAHGPERIAEEPRIAGCRLGWNGRELGVVWWAPERDGLAISMARVSSTGEVRERLRVETEGAATEPIDVTWHDDAWVVAYAREREAGVRTVEIEPGTGQRPGPTLARERRARGLALMSVPWIGRMAATWSEPKRLGSSKGRVYFDVLQDEHGHAPLELTEAPNARFGVNLDALGQRVATAWSTRSLSSTSVHWMVIMFRGQDETERYYGSLTP